MLRLCGSLCIFGAALWGLWDQRRQAQWQRQMRADLLSALRRMGEAIRLARTPLPRLLRQEAESCKTAEAADFFRSVAQAAAGGEDLGVHWQAHCEKLPLSQEERQALGELGHAFGGDEEQLCRAMTLASSVLQRWDDDSRARRAEEEKRSAALWLSAGALAVILLI